jgi:hypothetical protein
MRGGVLVAAAVLLAAVLSVCLAPPVDAATASSVGTALPSIHSLFSSLSLSASSCLVGDRVLPSLQSYSTLLSINLLYMFGFFSTD